MKKLSVTIFILAFMLSCLNKSTENGNTKNSNNTTNQAVTYKKPQNPQGPTVTLNSTDFKIENEFIYYQGNIFTGKITFETFYQSGYFHIKLSQKIKL